MELVVLEGKKIKENEQEGAWKVTTICRARKGELNYNKDESSVVLK